MFKKFAIALLLGAVSSVNAKEQKQTLYQRMQERHNNPFAKKEIDVETGHKNCLECTAAMRTASAFFGRDEIQDKIIDFSIWVCETFNIADSADEVCPGIVTMMGDVWLGVLADDILSKDRICNQFLGVCTNPEFVHVSVEDYTARVLADKPDIIKDDDFVNNLYDEIKNDPNTRETIRIVHFSDPHMDFHYKEGTNWLCNSYMCCREEDGYPTEPNLQAGKWGGYQCDLPAATVQSVMEHIRDVAQPEMIFWTGDNSAHDDWLMTEEIVTDYNLVVTQMFKDTFENTTIPIFPVLGNHDTFPVNIEDFDSPYAVKLINDTAAAWADWIGEEAAAKFTEYGYYSMDFDQAPQYGSKIIGLNTQAANTGNYWLAGNRNDPGDHIAWLETELASVEAAGGIAFIIGHIQPFSYQSQWGGRYRALMERYQHIIRFQMYGHTHDQYFSVTNSISNPLKHILVSQIGPSVTTNTYENPAYAIIDLDKETMLPLNYQIIRLDLEEANRSGVAEWELFTDYVSDYNLDGVVSPDEMYKLAMRIGADPDFASIYAWEQTRGVGVPTNMSPGAAFDMACQLATSEKTEQAACRGDNEPFDWNDFSWRDASGESIVNFMIGEWVEEASLQLTGKDLRKKHPK